MKPWLSLIIPLRNEAQQSFALLEQVAGLPGVEVLVVEGCSDDDTWKLLQAWQGTPGVRLLQAPPPRSNQLAQGVAQAQGDWLLLLHGDSQLESGWLEALQTFAQAPSAAAAAFSLRLAGGWPFTLYASAANLRSRLLGLPYGDQGLFLRKITLSELGGIPPLPLMEDLALVRALARRGGVRILAKGLWTSNRRFLALGLWRSFWINQRMLLGFFCGQDLEKLRLRYQSVKLSFPLEKKKPS